VPAHNPHSESYEGENTGPYDHTKYAQCDFLVGPRKWKHTVIDCESRKDLHRDSDHIPIHAKITTSMKRQNKADQEKGATKYYKPNNEQKLEFNRAIFELLNDPGEEERLEPGAGNPAPTLQLWIRNINIAAESHLSKVSDEKRQDYISQETWKLIQARNQKQKEGDLNKEVNKLNKEIKKRTFKDRKQKKLEEFNENPGDK
jgi:hypothetical protein